MKKLISLIQEIQEIDFNPHVNVLFCINFDRRNLGALLNLSYNDITTNQGYQFTTIFFKLERNTSQDCNRLSIVGEKVDFDLTEPNDIKGYFRRTVLYENMAKKYLLFTWDHGDGYGIFEGIGKGGHVTHRPEEKPVLTMKELKLAIAGAFGKKKLDLVIMLNCNMQLFDTAYSFKKNVKYLIAPQTDMESGHYDYNSIFKTLTGYPEMNGKLLSRMVIENFKNRESEFSDLTISACALSSVKPITRLLNQLAILYLRRIHDGEIGKLITEFQKAETSERSKAFIDFYSLLKQLTNLDDASEQEILDRLIPEMYGMVIDVFAKDDSFTEAGYQSHYGVSTITPFSLPIPRESLTEDKVMELTNYIKFTEFRLETGWGQLMTLIEEIY